MRTHSPKPNLLHEKTLHFAVRIVNLNRFLTREKNEFVLSKQIMRSGTNPEAMVREASNAESGLDFIHKLSIAQKETGETLYWLELLYKTSHITQDEYQSMKTDSEEILRLLTSSIITKKKNLALKASSILIALMSLGFVYTYI